MPAFPHAYRGRHRAGRALPAALTSPSLPRTRPTVALVAAAALGATTLATASPARASSGDDDARTAHSNTREQRAASRTSARDTQARRQVPARASRSAPKGALGPRATLARTPAARSAQLTRVASQVFPGLEALTWVGPVTGTHQTSDFGQRWGRLHAGLDFGGPVGTRLKSVSSGVVQFAGHQGGYGNKVEILHWDGSLTAYGHMSSVAVKTGQEVAPGQVIGRLGNSGRSTGPHLHFEVRPGGGEAIDPWPWLVQRGILPRDMPRS